MNNSAPADRQALKARAKELMRTALPAAWLVALVYQLATTVLSDVVSQFLPCQTELQEALSYYSAGQMDFALWRMNEIFTSPQGYILLFGTTVMNLFVSVVDYGYTGYTLGVVRGERPGYGELFSRFYMAGKIILALVMEVVFVALWTCLFIIPGLIAAYRYRMVVYCLLDDPDCSVRDAFARSKLMMDGRKWELCKLDLSFFPLIFGVSLLASIPALVLPASVAAPVDYLLTIAINLYFIPYQMFTRTGWYEAIRPRREADSVIDGNGQTGGFDNSNFSGPYNF